MSLSPDRSESAPRPGVSIIIPAYNEAGAIAQVITDIRRAMESEASVVESFEILVIDDGSTDDTALRAAQAGARVFSHQENLGYGAAVKRGLRNARFETIIMTDADGTYPATAMPELLNQLRTCDMAVGARTGDNVHIPAERRPAKWVLKITAEFLAGRRIPDLNSGLRAYRKTDAMRFVSLYPAGFSFTTTISLAYLSSDLLVRYIPIDYHPRTGRSKLRPIRDTKNLFLTVIRSILFFNPLRVCVPTGLLLLLCAACVATLRDTQGRMYDGTITILVTSALQIIIVGFLADILARVRDRG